MPIIFFLSWLGFAAGATDCVARLLDHANLLAEHVASDRLTYQQASDAAVVTARVIYYTRTRLGWRWFTGRRREDEGLLIHVHHQGPRVFVRDPNPPGGWLEIDPEYDAGAEVITADQHFLVVDGVWLKRRSVNSMVGRGGLRR